MIFSEHGMDHMDTTLGIREHIKNGYETEASQSQWKRADQKCKGMEKTYTENTKPNKSLYKPNKNTKAH